MQPTEETEIAWCLTCGAEMDLPKVVVRHHVYASRKHPITVNPAHCKRCRDRYLARVLPVHPYWMRTAGDGVVRAPIS